MSQSSQPAACTASASQDRPIRSYTMGRWRGPVMAPSGAITVVKPLSSMHEPAPSLSPAPPLPSVGDDDLAPQPQQFVAALPYSDSLDTPDSSDPSPPLATRFDPSPSQLPLISLIADWNSAHPDSSHLTLQQQSILRHRVLHNDVDALSLLASSPSFASLQSLSARILQQEDECRLHQHTELDVLRAIFQSELHISPTLPLTLRVLVRLDQVDCELELGFLLPPLYPLRDALVVNAFLPPPFSDLFAADLSLHDRLNDVARRKVGEEAGAMYEVVDAARQWMEGQLDRLKRSVERGAEERSEAESSFVRQLFGAVTSGAKGEDEEKSQQAVGLFGRGRVEELMQQAIQSTSQGNGITRAQAKALLKEKRWDVAEAGSASMLSGDDDEYVEGLKSAFADQFSSDTELTCLSCFDTFQWREGAMLRCHHFLCYSCYARYLLSHLNDGSAFIRDPGHKCVEAVSEELLFALLSPHDYRRYRRFVQDHFITVKGWTWCPNPHCSFVASSADPRGMVQCHCGTCYCVGCGKAGHWPLPCGAAAAYFGSAVVGDLRQKYNTLVELEAQREENEGLLTVKTKPCPKCKTHYERSEGQHSHSAFATFALRRTISLLAEC